MTKPTWEATVTPEDLPAPVITIETLFPWLGALEPAPVEEPAEEPLAEAA